jgi:hypothetical protein
MSQPFAFYPTGSAYIVDRVSAADKDLVVLFESFEQAQEYINLRLCGGVWEMCGQDYGDDGTHFKAIRSGDDNQIIVWDYVQFVRWMAFTELAKKLGMSSKMERIELSKALVDADPVAAQNICRYTPVYERMAEIADLYISS